MTKCIGNYPITMLRNSRCSVIKISHRKYVLVPSVNNTILSTKVIHLLRLVSLTTALPPREKSACSSIVCCYKRNRKKVHFSALRARSTINAATLVVVY